VCVTVLSAMAGPSYLVRVRVMAEQVRWKA
jgi:hypothetical protein